MCKSSLSTKEDVKAAAKKRMDAYNVTADEAGQGSAMLTEVDGKACLMHEIQPSDSIIRMSLTYNVAERDIRNLNRLFSDQIHHLEFLNIPMSQGFRFSAKEVMKEDEALTIENQIREQAIFMVSQYIGESQGR